jgi:protein tyrosine phosphatase (PTP) superfamily phosphohydrolase (DUF442 family)
MQALKKISAFYSYSELLAAGGQPSAEQMELLKKEGFELIINISPVSAKNALHNEHQLTEKLQMDYIHFPVDCSNLREIHYHTFRSLMQSAEKRKTFVHCGGNIKTSNLIHMYNVMEKGVAETESLKILKKIQAPEEKWFTFFKQMGMKGLNN